MGDVNQKLEISIGTKKKIRISFYYLTAYLLILYGYHYYLVPNYAYEGLKWFPDSTKILESMLLVLLLPIFLPVSFKKPSDVFLHIQLLFPIIPTIVLYGAANEARSCYILL